MTPTLANPAFASTLLAELFPSPVAAYELRESADPRTLLPQEAGTCEAFRPKRLAEFAAGRLCARRALQEIGFGDFALLRNTDRSPRWPEHAVGSITHTVGFCGAVAALRHRFAGLGIDAEIVARVTADLWTHVFTPGEAAHFPRVTASERERIAAVAFSAKEAFYKCQFRVTGGWLDYLDVIVDAVPEGPDKGTFSVHPATSDGRRILGNLKARGRYRIEGWLVFTGIALTIDDARTLLARNTVLPS
jgi:4'-phosphopantetheinyl transferase EntD